MSSPIRKNVLVYPILSIFCITNNSQGLSTVTVTWKTVPSFYGLHFFNCLSVCNLADMLTLTKTILSMKRCIIKIEFKSLFNQPPKL